MMQVIGLNKTIYKNQPNYQARYAPARPHADPCLELENKSTREDKGSHGGMEDALCVETTPLDPLLQLHSSTPARSPWLMTVAFIVPIVLISFCFDLVSNSNSRKHSTVSNSTTERPAQRATISMHGNTLNQQKDQTLCRKFTRNKSGAIKRPTGKIRPKRSRQGSRR